MQLRPVGVQRPAAALNQDAADAQALATAAAEAAAASGFLQGHFDVDLGAWLSRPVGATLADIERSVLPRMAAMGVQIKFASTGIGVAWGGHVLQATYAIDPDLLRRHPAGERIAARLDVAVTGRLDAIAAAMRTLFEVRHERGEPWAGRMRWHVGVGGLRDEPSWRAAFAAAAPRLAAEGLTVRVDASTFLSDGLSLFLVPLPPV